MTKFEKIEREQILFSLLTIRSAPYLHSHSKFTSTTGDTIVFVALHVGVDFFFHAFHHGNDDFQHSFPFVSNRSG